MGLVRVSIRRVALPVAAVLAVMVVPVSAAAPTFAATGTFQGTVLSGKTAKQVISVSAPGHIHIDLSWPEMANLNLFLKSPSGTALTSATSQLPSTETLDYDIAVGAPLGNYSVTVKSVTGDASWTMNVSFPGISAPSYVGSLGGGTSGQAGFYPSGLDVDPAGNLYVADTANDKIRAFSPTGVLLWTTGSRGSKAIGRFGNPRDVAYLAGKVYVADTVYRRVQVLDAATGNPLSVWAATLGTVMGISAGLDGSGQPIILVAETSTNVVRIYRPDGTFVQTVGTGLGAGDGQMNQIRDATTDLAGNIYVADYINDRIAQFSPVTAVPATSGKWVKNFGVRGVDVGQLKRPYGVDTDAAGNLYVADGNDRVQVYTPAGVYDHQLGSRGPSVGQFQFMRRVAVDDGPSPRVCGADFWNYRIECFDQAGNSTMQIGPTPPADGFFNEPYGLTVDSDKTFVMDTDNQRIAAFNPDGTYSGATFGSRGWGQFDSGFNWARDITTYGGTTGTLWVADTKNSRLLEFSRSGVPTPRVLGAPGSGNGQLNWPYAITTLGTDLIVADTLNHRVLRWNPDSATPTWTSSVGFLPQDVTVANGLIYVADGDNHRIVVLDGNGAMVSTIGASVLHKVAGVAVAPNGNIWVADTSFNRLVEFDSAGNFVQAYGKLGSLHGNFNQPTHLEIAPGTAGGPDRLYVADVWNDRIEMFSIS